MEPCRRSVIDQRSFGNGKPIGNHHLYTYRYKCTWCSNTATRTVVVNPLPAAITGITALCSGTSITLANLAAGGSWSSNNVAIATIGSVSGVLTGVAAGTTFVTYTLTTGCYKKAAVTVNPAVPSIVVRPAYVRERLLYSPGLPAEYG